MTKRMDAEHGVVCRLPGEKFGYFGWPTIARLDDGRLVAASSGLRSEHVCPWGKTVLNVSSDVAGIARVGPIRAHADSVMGVLRSPRTAVHLVALLEEMPVQETLDAIESLREVDLPVGSIIVNMIRRPLLTDTELAAARLGVLDHDQVTEQLLQVLPPHTQPAAVVASALLAEAADHAMRVEQEDDQRLLLGRSGRPTVELPFLSSGIDLGALYELGELLCGSDD